MSKVRNMASRRRKPEKPRPHADAPPPKLATDRTVGAGRRKALALPTPPAATRQQP